MKTNRPKPVVLLILDGYGVAPKGGGNAILQADTPVLDKLVITYPTMTLFASGQEVGLNWGEMGNSEVGHLNIGAGRVYYQMLPRINKSIADGSFFTNKVFLASLEHARKNKSKLHLIGLTSPGGVHSHQDHLYALLELCKREKFRDVYIHAILDGRDTIYNTAKDFIGKLEEKLREVKLGQIATLSGRYYALDRDNRWDRVEKAYKAMVAGEGNEAENALSAIEASYENKIYDEEFVPTVLKSHDEQRAKIQDNDAVIFWNFREDRARELSYAFVLPSFEKFSRGQYMKNLYFATMTEYEKDLPIQVAFLPDIITDSLAKVISDAGLNQLHLAETEKYAHVTFFLNGQREEPFKKEERLLIPSPKVASYDQRPAMSAKEITTKVVKAITESDFDFIVANFANPDMVGHTGNLEATRRAIEVVDRSVGDIVNAALLGGGIVFITADHGNAEELQNLQTGKIDKEHSTNTVPFIIVSRDFENQTNEILLGAAPDLSVLTPVGVLGDVAPTILKIMGLPQPEEMTGKPLL